MVKKINESNLTPYEREDMLDCIENILNYVDNLSDEIDKQGKLVSMGKISNTLSAIGANAYTLKRTIENSVW